MKIPRFFAKTLPLFLLLFVCLSACKEDEKEPETNPVDTNPIVGTWQLNAITPEVAGTRIPALDLISLVTCMYQLKLTFKSDNTLTAADCQAAVTAVGTYVPIGTDAKWKVDGDKLTLSNKDISRDFKITQTATDLTVVVNTELDTSKPAANALLKFKRI